MDTRYQRIAVYVVIIAILIGVGFLIYRFVQSPHSANVKTVVINGNGKFTQTKLKLTNSDVLKIRNDDNKTHTVKRASSDTAFVQIKAHSTSRELNVPDNTLTTLYVDDSKNEKIALVVGSAPEPDDDTNTATTPPTVTPPATTPPASQPGEVAGATDNLPNTGPENLYFIPIFIAAGFALVKLSKKILY